MQTTKDTHTKPMATGYVMDAQRTGRTLNASVDRYLTILHDEIWPVVNHWEKTEDMTFMQDIAPPHFAIVVRDWQNEHFPERWLGQREPHEWSARNPDSTPCDLCLGVGERKEHTL